MPISGKSEIGRGAPDDRKRGQLAIAISWSGLPTR
jgi:hypothetical protein